MRHFKLLLVPVFLFLASCSEESIQDITEEGITDQEEVTNPVEFLQSNELLISNFLPTFTNYYGRDHGTSTNRSSSLASEWIHEFDETGRLVKSYFYELYPYRILKEITYLEIVGDNKLKYEIKQFGYYGLKYSFTDTYELTFDENLNIRTIGDAGTFLEEFTEDGWVTKISVVMSNGDILYQTGYEYDEEGNILTYISYDNPNTGSASVDHTYNENGDPLTYHFQNSQGAETIVQYYYREDNTLERLEVEYKNEDGEFGTEIYTYSAEERLVKQIFNKGDGTKEVVTYTEDEIVEEHFKNDGELSDVFLYQVQGESYSLKLHKEYLNGILHIIKYYDAEGNLEYTEYYDENGNITETVYE